MLLVMTMANAAALAESVTMPKLRKFETKCLAWDSDRAFKFLPPRQEKGAHPEHVLIEVLAGMTQEDVLSVSAESAHLKRLLKVPLVLFVTTAAMC